MVPLLTASSSFLSASVGVCSSNGGWDRGSASSSGASVGEAVGVASDASACMSLLMIVLLFELSIVSGVEGSGLECFVLDHLLFHVPPCFQSVCADLD